MNVKQMIISIIVVSLSLTTGCAMNRSNVTELSKKQDEYYNNLINLLEENKDDMEISLKDQLKADKKRELDLLAWERDLKKAEVLLQVDANVTGNQRLLSMKLAEINLEEVINLSNTQINEARKEIILKLYQKLIDALKTLKENNDIIVKYLSSSNAEFVLRSFDIDSIIMTVSAIRSVQEELGQIEKRTEEERKKESERIQKAIERSRDVLIKVYKKAS